MLREHARMLRYTYIGVSYFTNSSHCYQYVLYCTRYAVKNAGTIIHIIIRAETRPLQAVHGILLHRKMVGARLFYCEVASHRN